MTRSKPRVLVVDDDAAIRTLIAAVLTREGLTFSLASNGREAVDLFAESSYDVVLLDLMMPVMTGFDVIEYVEKSAPDRLPQCFIILTAASPREVQKIEGKAVFAVIRKPFDLVELVENIRRCAAENQSEEMGCLSPRSATLETLE